MLAIAFDLEVATLEREYGNPCTYACVEVRRALEALDFARTQGSAWLPG